MPPTLFAQPMALVPGPEPRFHLRLGRLDVAAYRDQIGWTCEAAFEGEFDILRYTEQPSAAIAVGLLEHDLRRLWRVVEFAKEAAA